MSLYADYIKERANKECIETTTGFAVYSISGDYCYIEDIYVIDQHRKNGYATMLANSITTVAKEKGCKYLLGTVCPAAKGSTESLKVLLAYGMKLYKSDQSLIWFIKEI